MSSSSETLTAGSEYAKKKSTSQKVSGLFARIKSRIVSITSVLVVVPALLNAGLDIYNRINNIPASEGERTNVELFTQNFGKTPILKENVSWEGAAGKISMELEVHEGGDILVRYGNSSQWLRSPVYESVSAFEVFSSAYAQDTRADGEKAIYKRETMQGKRITQELYFKDNSKETRTVNKRTGRWSNPMLGQYTKVPVDAVRVEQGRL
jgi:hypothetical protein